MYKRSLLLQIAFYSSSLLFRRFGNFFFLFPQQYLCARRFLVFFFFLFYSTIRTFDNSSRLIRSSQCQSSYSSHSFHLLLDERQRRERDEERKEWQKEKWRDEFDLRAAGRLSHSLLVAAAVVVQQQSMYEQVIYRCIRVDSHPKESFNGGIISEQQVTADCHSRCRLDITSTVTKWCV